MPILWTLEKRKLKDLKDYAKNPRTLTKDQEAHLSASIEKFGLIDKPIVNLDGTLIGGHQRKRVLKKLGLKEVDCYVPDRLLTEKEVEELNIRLNKNTGDFDFDILANQWETLDLLNWGFTADELQIADPTETEIEDDSSEVLEPGKDEDARTKLGDLYELNGHRIICGDSTDASIASRLLDGAIPILMVTDPPYGVEYDPEYRDKASVRLGKNKANGIVQNDSIVDWSEAWKLFPGNIAYVWHASGFCPQVQYSLNNVDFEFISQIIWVKQHFALSRGDYHWQHEVCLYVGKKGQPHNWQGSRKEATVWEISNLNAFGGKSGEGDERTAHSTQKPIECMAKPIRNNTAKGEGVYDPFLGSGTTLIAAEQLGRTCYGIELSPAYCDIIVDRWVKHMVKNGKEFTIKLNGELIEWQKHQ